VHNRPDECRRQNCPSPETADGQACYELDASLTDRLKLAEHCVIAELIFCNDTQKAHELGASPATIPRRLKSKPDTKERNKVLGSFSSGDATAF
jgi:hypothetical protein